MRAALYVELAILGIAIKDNTHEGEVNDGLNTTIIVHSIITVRTISAMKTTKFLLLTF